LILLWRYQTEGLLLLLVLAGGAMMRLMCHRHLLWGQSLLIFPHWRTFLKWIFIFGWLDLVNWGQLSRFHLHFNFSLFRLLKLELLLTLLLDWRLLNDLVLGSFLINHFNIFFYSIFLNESKTEPLGLMLLLLPSNLSDSVLLLKIPSKLPLNISLMADIIFPEPLKIALIHGDLHRLHLVKDFILHWLHEPLPL
jgi:hypothetical protein